MSSSKNFAGDLSRVSFIIDDQHPGAGQIDEASGGVRRQGQAGRFSHRRSLNRDKRHRYRQSDRECRSFAQTRAMAETVPPCNSTI